MILHYTNENSFKHNTTSGIFVLNEKKRKLFFSLNSNICVCAVCRWNWIFIVQNFVHRFYYICCVSTLQTSANKHFIQNVHTRTCPNIHAHFPSCSSKKIERNFLEPWETFYFTFFIYFLYFHPAPIMLQFTESRVL